MLFVQWEDMGFPVTSRTKASPVATTHRQNMSSPPPTAASADSTGATTSGPKYSNNIQLGSVERCSPAAHRLASTLPL